MNHNFKELKIWQKGIDLVDISYDFASTLPKDEKYNLVSQITRCACSVPTNIAEGCGKRTSNHFAEFLSTSLGSCFELETHLVICERRNFGKTELRIELTEKINELKNMIFNFREKISGSGKS
ncbi:MAG: four helix bundle protein [Bacteroidetes bacterium]|jgi:four helix bundle protein|nr:four helix bundle protein [Bacteroidota bacterium]MDF2453628.1 four helix bundle protein [Bacteroidota bacterium]